MTHKSVLLPPVPSGSPREAVLAAAPDVLAALEAYRKARRGERVELEVRENEVEWEGSDRGRMLLRWREEIDLACRMERAGEGLSATVKFRQNADGSVVLEMLDEAALEERSDDL